MHTLRHVSIRITYCVLSPVMPRECLFRVAKFAKHARHSTYYTRTYIYICMFTYTINPFRHASYNKLLRELTVWPAHVTVGYK